MGFKPGHQKLGGRQKGTPNKITRDLFKACEEEGVDPFRGLLKLSGHEDPNIAMNAHKELCQYLYPKRKSLEHSGEIDTRPYQDLSEEELDAEITRLKNQATGTQTGETLSPPKS